MLTAAVYTNPEINAIVTKGFELWYQPVYRVPAGTVVHNEVLLRWRDPDGHLHYPEYFMPLVAQTDQQQWLDRLVINKTVQALGDNPEQTLSVNLTHQALEDFDLLDNIQSLLEKYAIPPHRLNVEISERAIAQNLATGIAFVRQLQALGCWVILDDFANQYLSFLQWERLNVNAVKVERSLLRDLGSDIPKTHLVESIVDVSHQLGMSAIAKFFDASSHANSIQRLHFDAVQGFHRKPPSQRPSLSSNVNILGVSIDNLSQQEFLTQLQSGIVFIPASDHLRQYRSNQQLRQAYTIADYKICDSNLLWLTSRLLGNPIKEKISSSDFFSGFYHYHRNNLEITIFLLGGTAEVVAKAQANINRKVGRSMVVDTYSPPLEDWKSEQNCLEIVKRIKCSAATVLAIGIGVPNPEQWVYQYREQLPAVKIIFTIGTTLHIEAGESKPIPTRIKSFGTRCLHRLLGLPQQLAGMVSNH